MKTTHVIHLPTRNGMLEVIEEKNRILLNLTFDKYGFFGDEAEINGWMLSILDNYQNDIKPFVLTNPITGQVGTIFGNEKTCMVIIEA